MTTPDNTILVVDDDSDICSIVREVLSIEGFKVETAANGREALQQIRSKHPKLILLDMRMPVMDGWQLTRSLKDDHSSIPIVVMTAARDAGVRAREIDAEGYIAKPFDIDDLIEAVRAHLCN